jgi:hypothetical protein
MKSPERRLGAFLPFRIWRLAPFQLGYARRLPLSSLPPRIAGFHGNQRYFHSVEVDA